ncbi:MULTISPECIES: ABC transporter permease subunit [Rhodomicrobium]|uniref:amino acid ABC transporter permease n=1 Tax=Rhodomicrobium TaxID=1068 RepID=UPI001AECD51B|nr:MULTISPECIES: ABC transporter permease subunit [Rhodomicrobium]
MSEMSATAPRRRPSGRQFAWRDVWHDLRFRALGYQVLVVAAIIGLAMFFIGNAQDALHKRGISTGFDFLSQAAGFDIGEAPIAFTSADSFLRAYAAAVLNTLKVSAIGIVLATVIGVAVGLARLSGNALIRGFASAYVELFRNTPQLVQLIFWYTLIAQLPVAKQAIPIFDLAFISNRGLVLPWPSDAAAFARVLLALALAIAAAILLRRRQRRSGLAALALIAVAPLAVWMLHGAPTGFSVPRLQGFNFQGGVTISPEFLALLLGLSLYIGAFIAEIVRSGIQSVGKGQLEAARAIGLRPRDTYRKIVLPQALRVMVPPAASQYMSLVKNSSLGVAIGYPELFNVNNTIITLSGHTIEAIGIMMAIYLTLSLAIAALMNIYNRSVQIRER